MLSVKQGGIKNHFFSLWYDSAWDWTPISWVIGEHSNRFANGPVIYGYIIFFCVRFWNLRWKWKTPLNHFTTKIMKPSSKKILDILIQMFYYFEILVYSNKFSVFSVVLLSNETKSYCVDKQYFSEVNHFLIQLKKCTNKVFFVISSSALFCIISFLYHK